MGHRDGGVGERVRHREPNRFRALYGAATSAALAGDGAKARGDYGQIVKLCERGDTPGRPEREEARRSLSR